MEVDEHNMRTKRVRFLVEMFFTVVITASVMLGWFAFRDSFPKKHMPPPAPIVVQGVY